MTHKQTKRQLKAFYLVELYRQANSVEDELDLEEASKWAYENGHWKPFKIDPARILRREMAQALRSKYHEDPQNREVRKYHPIIDRAAGKVTWVDITKASPEKMRLSFSAHRNRILAECKQLSFDFDSYNDNNTFGAKLPALYFDFTADIEESKLPPVYA